MKKKLKTDIKSTIRPASTPAEILLNTNQPSQEISDKSKDEKQVVEITLEIVNLFNQLNPESQRYLLKTLKNEMVKNDDSDMVSIEEASYIFNVHPRTVQYWINHQKIKAEKINRKWMISREEIKRKKSELES